MSGTNAGPRLEEQDRCEEALAAAGVVGTWRWDHRRKVARYSIGAAQLLAGDPALAGRDLDADQALAGVYADDVAWLRSQMHQVASAPGVSIREHRVRSNELGIRSVLCRGRTYHDAAGRATVTMGIVIDITDIEADGRVRFGGVERGALEDAAEHGITVYEAIQTTGLAAADTTCSGAVAGDRPGDRP